MSFHSATTGALGADDLARIERVARTEIRLAFEGLRFALSDSRTAAYRVRVAPAVYHPAFRARLEVAGASSAIAVLGGHGAVSFRLLASGAVARAAPGAAREAVIEGIGRGIGRTVVHELVHQLLPTTPFDTSDVGSYEYESADRVEQYSTGMAG